MTANVRSAFSLASTSHTRRSLSAYTTRIPESDPAGTVSGCFVGFGAAVGRAEGALEAPGVGTATEAGAFADA